MVCIHCDLLVSSTIGLDSLESGCVSGLVLLFLELALSPAKVTLPLFLKKVVFWLSKKVQLLMTAFGSSRLVFGDTDVATVEF